MRRTRGVASIIEAMIVSIAVALLVFIAFGFFAGYYKSLSPQISYKDIDVVLCGEVLAIKNVGETPIRIEGGWGIYYRVGHTGLYVEADWLSGISGTINPGEMVTYELSKPYMYVVIKTYDKRLPPVRNSCIEEYFEYGGGGIR